MNREDFTYINIAIIFVYSESERVKSMSTLGFLKCMYNQKRILVKGTNVRTVKRKKVVNVQHLQVKLKQKL